MATASVNLKTRTGNRVDVTFGGVRIGGMQSVRMSQDYGHEGVYEIGSPEPIENVPGAARYPLSASNVVLIKGAMKKAGIAAENADAVLKGLVFDIEVFDKDSGELIQKYMGCSYTGGDTDVNRNQIIISSAQFLALTVSGTGF